MSAGRLVFPVIMVVFVGFFVSFLASTPAQKATDSPDSRLVRARDGDSVLIEFTAYYGEPGKGKAFFSTQEERQASLPRGDIAPGFQEDPLAVHLTAGEPAGGLRVNLLGHRAGDEFTTPKVAAKDAFGDWQQDRQLPRTLAELSYVVTFDSSTDLGPGRTFNVTEYVEFWANRGTNLTVGTEWPCEGTALWNCRVDNMSVPANTFVYRRMVAADQHYPVQPLWGGLPVAGDMRWNFTTTPGSGGDLFAIRLDPPPGARFQFLQDAGGSFVAGTYEVVSLQDDTITVHYTTALPSEPALVGLPVYYDIEVVRITRRDA